MTLVHSIFLSTNFLPILFTLGFYLRFLIIAYQLEGIKCFEGIRGMQQEYVMSRTVSYCKEEKEKTSLRGRVKVTHDVPIGCDNKREDTRTARQQPAQYHAP
jgi:hypothetical protein